MQYTLHMYTLHSQCGAHKFYYNHVIDEILGNDVMGKTVRCIFMVRLDLKRFDHTQLHVLLAICHSIGIGSIFNGSALC